MTTYFNHVKIDITSYTDVKQPDFDGKKAFYCIYSPERFMLRPKDDIYLDLKIKINVPAYLEPWINLLPSLKERVFKIEEPNWSANKLKDDAIQLHIFKRSFTYNTHIKKIQIVAYMFLLGEKATYKIFTKYSIFT